MIAKSRGFAKRLCTLCALILAAGWATASNGETFAVLSIVGDHLTVIGMGAQLGSHIDQNRRQTMEVTGTGFDDFAVRVADAAIAKARPESSVTALRGGDPALYKLGESWLESDTVEMKQLVSFPSLRISSSSSSTSRQGRSRPMSALCSERPGPRLGPKTRRPGMRYRRSRRSRRSNPS